MVSQVNEFLQENAALRPMWVVGEGVDWRVLATLHAAVLGLVLLPLLLVDVPALVDYPNPLARIRIPAPPHASPDLQAIYPADWAFLPNLAMDALVPLVLRVTGVIWGGKLFIALTTRQQEITPLFGERQGGRLAEV